MDLTAQATIDIETFLASRTLLDALVEGVYCTDKERKILLWNNGAEQITGFSASEVAGSHCWNNILQHVDAEGRSLCHGACPLVRSMRTGENVVAEVFLTHKMGHRLPVVIRTIPLRDRNGTIAGAVEIFAASSSGEALHLRLKELEQQSLIDPLTGLLNRRGLEKNLRAEFERKKRFGSNFGVTFLDIDNFKTINDTHGHAVGDDALRLVARTLIGNSRPFDLPGRWGGDEMLVINNSIDMAALYKIAERFRMLLHSSMLMSPAGPIPVTISVGSTIVRDGDTMATIIRRADTLMYSSKKAGKNRVTIA